MTTNNSMKLRIQHIPRVLGPGFTVPVSSPEEGARLLKILAEYDQFQFDNRIRNRDYVNSQGLEVFEDGEWVEWCDEDGNNVREAFGGER
jgi:hypothetical protein